MLRNSNKQENKHSMPNRTNRTNLKQLESKFSNYPCWLFFFLVI